MGFGGEYKGMVRRVGSRALFSDNVSCIETALK